MGPLYIPTYLIYKLWALWFHTRFLNFSHYKSMEKKKSKKMGQIGSQRLTGSNICRGPLNIATY